MHYMVNQGILKEILKSQDFPTFKRERKRVLGFRKFFDNQNLIVVGMKNATESKNVQSKVHVNLHLELNVVYDPF